MPRIKRKYDYIKETEMKVKNLQDGYYGLLTIKVCQMA